MRIQPTDGSDVSMNDEPAGTLSIEVRSFAKSPRKICGRDANGKFCTVSETEAIRYLQDGTWALFTRLNGREIPIVIAADLAGNKFLATRVDGKITDDLLTLPDALLEDGLLSL